MKHIYFFSLVAVIGIISLPQKAKALFFKGQPDSIQIYFDKNQLVLPGETFKIGVIAHHKKGKSYKTLGMKGGSVLWWKYKAKIVGGEKTGGKITVNKKLMPAKGKYVSVKIWPRKKPNLSKTILIPLNYETSVTFQATSKFDKAPGCSFKGEIVAEFNNGMIRKSKHHRTGKDFKNYRIFTRGINWKIGKFTIEPDFEKIIDHQVSLQITPRRNPEITSTYPILLDYIHDYRLSFSGSSGTNGFDGSDGSCTFFGGDGSHGTHGYDGSGGYHGPDIGLWTDQFFDSLLNCNLLYVYAENFETGKTHKFLINPNGGGLRVRSYGGDGGRGGNGGDGGEGGQGANGEVWYEEIEKTRTVKKPFKKQVTKKVKKTIINSEGKPEEVEVEVTEEITVYRDVKEKYTVKIQHQDPGQDGGNGGHAGSGGWGGPGGNGGNIYLFFTDDARNASQNIIAQSIAGDGGWGGNSGDGGQGGKGGQGDPNGRNGYCGSDGYSGERGQSGDEGRIYIEKTEEFFFNETAAIAQKENLPGPF